MSAGWTEDSPRIPRQSSHVNVLELQRGRVVAPLTLGHRRVETYGTRPRIIRRNVAQKKDFVLIRNHMPPPV